MTLRLWIFKALCAVILDKAYSNLYLKDHLQQLPGKDQALATQIFYGTLQNYDYCQALWKPYASRLPEPKIRILLTFSAYQLAFLDKVPAYAVINDAVAIARKLKKSGGFVNAVLRKVAQHPELELDDSLESQALKASLPVWLLKMWSAQYGEEKARQMAQATLASRPVYVRPNPLQITAEEFVQDPNIQPSDHDLYIYKGGRIFDHPFYKEGKMSVQDEGSYQIARYVQAQPGQSILDICAAPGTKTMAMAEMMQDQGDILALDLYDHRAALIDQDAQRLHLKSIHTQARDSRDLKDLPQYDTVLCDVPCSGYGILARKPDMKLNLSPEDMDTLIPLQAALLNEAAQHVKEDGHLIYSTCTMNKKENEKQVEAFLQKHPQFQLEAQQTIFMDEQQDGFYMARLKKGQ